MLKEDTDWIRSLCSVFHLKTILEISSFVIQCRYTKWLLRILYNVYPKAFLTPDVWWIYWCQWAQSHWLLREASEFTNRFFCSLNPVTGSVFHVEMASDKELLSRLAWLLQWRKLACFARYTSGVWRAYCALFSYSLSDFSFLFLFFLLFTGAPALLVSQRFLSEQDVQWTRSPSYSPVYNTRAVHQSYPGARRRHIPVKSHQVVSNKPGEALWFGTQLVSRQPMYDVFAGRWSAI